MMLKVGSEFLEFDEDVELERQALLFEELSETRGDFSYSFNIPRTHKNCGILGQPFPDNVSKPVYTRIDCQLMSDSGSVLHIGFLRIEQLTKRNIVTSFFSGNSNWLSLLTGDMTELELSQYDTDITNATITSSWATPGGIVFPLLDAGALISRSYKTLMIEDFVGCFYLHILMKEVLQQSGLKLVGELINDPLYKNLVVVTNTRSKGDIDNNSMYAGKDDDQLIPMVDDPIVIHDVTFNLHSSPPYYLGSDVTFTSDIEFTPAVDMRVNISFSWVVTQGLRWQIRLDGVTIGSNSESGEAVAVTETGAIGLEGILIRAGQVLKVTCFNTSVFDSTITSANLKITPVFIYKAWGRSCVPLWTKLDFVTNVLSLFNCVTDYDPYSKMITANLFEKIKSKTPVDLSPYIDDSEQTIDYSEFISNYGKNTTLTYQTSDDNSIQEYNIASFVKYAEGVIEVENEMIPESATLLESDFSTPISYLNAVFDTSLEKINFVELDEVESLNTTSVTNDSGDARLNITDADETFTVLDLVRIESETLIYNGEYQVSTVTSSYIKLEGLPFDGNDDVSVTLLRHNVTTDESIYLMRYIVDINVTDISPTMEAYMFDAVEETAVGYAYFNLLNTGTQVNEDFKQGLAFGEITDPLFYQRTMIQTYWGTASRVLNDPVKLVIRAYLPESVYSQISPLTPIRISTGETTNLYYRNKDTGIYPCQVELIKLP